MKKTIKKSASKGFSFVLKTFIIIACLLVAGAFLTLGGNVVVKDGQLNVTNDFFVSTNVLFVDSAGSKVGIGTTGPNEKLTVVGNVNITENITIGDKLTFAFNEFIDNLVDGWLRITGSLNITGDLNVIGNITGGSPVKIKGGLNVLNASGTTHLYINDTTGNVGIGTATPAGLLHVKTQAIGSIVTGGTLTSDATYYYRTFTGSGTFGVSGAPLTADVLVVGGGGGGSGNTGGGAGAGGYRSASLILAVGNTSVVVGAGGSAGLPAIGTDGGNSSIGSFTASGGAKAAYYLTAGYNGGSGSGGTSGGAGVYYAGGSGNIGGYTPVEGYGGGTPFAETAGYYLQSGGGGAGGPGGNGTGTASGNGGIGSNDHSTWAAVTGTGVNGYYAGGGGGSIYQGGGLGTAGIGGAGGGANGSSFNTAGLNGIINTGGGASSGSGGGAGTSGGAGGSGIVIVRYLKTAVGVAAIDALVVTSNGKVGIGRTPATNDLEVEGTASKTTAATWLANSDMRIKTDIQDIDNALDTISRLRPVKFKYTDEYKQLHPSVEDKYYYNFIAQEYQEVFPESVKGSGEYLEGDDGELLQMESYNAQVVAIRAIQELKAENEALKKRIETLENN